MMGWRSRTVAVALSLALAASAVVAGDEDIGAVAPDGRWYTTGGCAARTARTDTAPLLDSPTPDWSSELPGVIEEEPLVWDDRVFVTCRDRAKLRTLHVLDRRTGRPLCAPQAFATELPLCPTVQDGRVLLRPDRDRLAVLDIVDGNLTTVWQRKADFTFGPPLWFESEIYVVDGDALKRLDMKRERPVWWKMGVYRGRPSLRGRDVFAMRFDRPQPWVEAISRNGGHREHLFDLSERLAVPDEHADIRLTVLDDRVAVQLPPFGGGTPDMFSRHIYLGPRRPTAEYELLTLRVAGEIAELGESWLGYLDDPEAGRFLGAPIPGRGNEFTLFATGRVHREFLYPARSASTARQLAFVGHRAFDPESGRIQWLASRPARFRAVPLRRALVVVDGPGRITYLRGRTLDDSTRIWPVPGKARGASSPSKSEVYENAIVVRRDGTIDRTSLTITRDPDAPGLQGPGVSIDDIAYAETSDSRPLYGTSARDLLHSVLRLATGTLPPGSGASKRNETPTEGRRVRSLRVSPADAVFARAKHVDDPDLETLLILLREVLEREPDHSSARARVRSLLPDRVATTEPFDALDALEFLDIGRSLSVEFLDPAATGSPGHSATQQPGVGALLQARRDWRPDLVAFRSPRLLVVTPVAQRPGAVARCLSLGELVCSSLAGIFEVDQASPMAADQREPLTLYLYESRAEYIDRAAGESEHARGEQAGLGLEWTAGFYARSTNLSHIFLPQGASGFDELGETYAHELTHHWVQEYIDAMRPGRARPPESDRRGYWVVEGFATFIQEQPFDLARRQIDDNEPFRKATSMTFVAESAADQLLPWDLVLGASWEAYIELSLEETDEIEAASHLGRVRTVSPMRAFYLQSAAACHYLYHADGGRRRGALLEYLRRFYTRSIGPRDFTTLFGATPAEVGAATMDFSRQFAR